jgi:hypothetical protein
VPRFLPPAQNVAPVEASTEMLGILHESEHYHSEGITTGDESRFQYFYCSPSLKLCVRSLTDVISRRQQAIGAKQTIITIVFTGRKLIVLAVLPKENNVNQLYCVDPLFLI